MSKKVEVLSTSQKTTGNYSGQRNILKKVRSRGGRRPGSPDCTKERPIGASECFFCQLATPTLGGVFHQVGQCDLAVGIGAAQDKKLASQTEPSVFVVDETSLPSLHDSSA